MKVKPDPRPLKFRRMLFLLREDVSRDGFASITVAVFAAIAASVERQPLDLARKLADEHGWRLKQQNGNLTFTRP